MADLSWLCRWAVLGFRGFGALGLGLAIGGLGLGAIALDFFLFSQIFLFDFETPTIYVRSTAAFCSMPERCLFEVQPMSVQFPTDDRSCLHRYLVVFKITTARFSNCVCSTPKQSMPFFAQMSVRLSKHVCFGFQMSRVRGPTDFVLIPTRCLFDFETIPDRYPNGFSSMFKQCVCKAHYTCSKLKRFRFDCQHLSVRFVA